MPAYFYFKVVFDPFLWPLAVVIRGIAATLDGPPLFLVLLISDVFVWILASLCSFIVHFCHLPIHVEPLDLIRL